MPITLREVPGWLKTELRNIDPKLAIRWNERAHRWVVMRKRENTSPPSALTRRDIVEREWWQYVSVFTWEEPDGSYRELDMRLIHALRKSDLHTRDFRDILAEMEREEEQRDKAYRDRILAVEEEMYSALHDCVVGRAFSGAYADSKRQA